MNNKAFFWRIFGLSCIFYFGTYSKVYSQQKLADYVDTSIGVKDNRVNNCVIGPMMPYGSIHPSPQTLRDPKDRYGGHDGYDPRFPIIGFGQLHVSGTGWGSYGHFLISPQVGLNVGKGTHDSPKSEEITKAYYYKTKLNRYNLIAEVSPRHYSAMYRFRFPKSDSASIVFDASQSIGLDIATIMGGTIYENSASIDAQKQQLSGKIKIRSGWPEGAYTLYFVAKIDKKFSDWGVWRTDTLMPKVSFVENNRQDNRHIGTYCQFSTKLNEEVLMKVAISFKGCDQAEIFLNQEITDWNFDQVVQKGKTEWENKLNAIQINATSEDKTMFYSYMYRVLTMASDRSKDNPNWISNQPYWDDNYAFWDTWRTAFPMMLLIDNRSFRDNVLALLDRFKHNGFVRDGFIAGRDKLEEQGGNDVDNILAEAILKNLQGLDVGKVYKLLKFNADNERNGLPDKFWKTDTLSRKNNRRYKELGWIPKCVMSSSNTLEYAYNDFCVAQVALKLGKKDDYQKYIERSRGWVNLWNDTLTSYGFRGFMDARNYNLSYAAISPRKNGGSWKTPFYEGDAWTYSFGIPHGYSTLFEFMGGKENYVKRLEFAFQNRLIDLTNEPAFLITRSFSDAGRPDLTSYWTHYVMNNYYDATGYPGNDDTGAMSSWYMFSAMGIFPKAGTEIYYLNAPKYPQISVDLGNGRKLRIRTEKITPKSIYIRSCKINGKVWNSPTFQHKDIVDGALIEMELSETPTNWAKN